MNERVGRETSILEVAGSKPKHNKVLLIRGFFYFFLFHFIKVLFCRVVASDCEAQLHLCINIGTLRKSLSFVFVVCISFFVH